MTKRIVIATKGYFAFTIQRYELFQWQLSRCPISPTFQYTHNVCANIG